jgi:hypothetical protein
MQRLAHVAESGHQQGTGGAPRPAKKNRTSPINFSPDLYRSRNLVERFFSKIK